MLQLRRSEFCPSWLGQEGAPELQKRLQLADTSMFALLDPDL